MHIRHLKQFCQHCLKDHLQAQYTVLQLNNTRVAVIVYMCIQFHCFLNWFESRTLLKPRTYRLEYG